MMTTMKMDQNIGNKCALRYLSMTRKNAKNFALNQKKDSKE